MNEKTRQYFEKAREEASKEAFVEIRQNDFKYKSQYSSGFLVLPELEFAKNSIELDTTIKKSDNTNSMYLFLNMEEGCDIMIGNSDGTVKYLATLVTTPFYTSDFLNTLNHRRHITNILEAPPDITITRNKSSKFNERFGQWDFV